MSQFEKQSYINVETYRKNGEAVRTPVWFVSSGGELCFTTEGSSGKVKRMRRNPAVKVAPCKVNGEVTGEWQPATARFMEGAEVDEVKNIYKRKYGLMKKIFDLFGRARSQETIFVAIRLDDQK